MSCIEAGLDRIVGFITRPQRKRYLESELGPSFMRYQGSTYRRVDFDLPYSAQLQQHSEQLEQLEKPNLEALNNKDEIIKCSLFHSQNKISQKCIIFTHGNVGNRLYGCEMLETALDYGYSYVCFDFLGCGNSGGNFITLGFEEKFQIQQVIEDVARRFQIKEFILAGRSMGAAAALMFIQHCYLENKRYRIAGIILDSPYCDMGKLFEETADQHLVWMPTFVTNWAIRQVDKRINLKLYPEKDFSLIQNVKINEKLKVDFPIGIIYGLKDKIIQKQHVLNLFSLLETERKLFVVPEQGHDEPREKKIKQSVLNWILSKKNKK